MYKMSLPRWSDDLLSHTMHASGLPPGRYEGGQEWSPIPCTKCLCQDGQTTCYPIQCTPLVCPQVGMRWSGVVTNTVYKMCLPGWSDDLLSHTVHTPGLSPGRYEDGQEWSPIPCTKCTRQDGQMTCYPIQCTPLVCPQVGMRTVRSGPQYHAQNVLAKMVR